MNAQVDETRRFLSLAPVGELVSWWKTSERKVKGRTQPVKGYALMHGSQMLGFIETTMPLPRIEELLEQYTSPHSFHTARELMRELLNAEDYRSNIYDVIVRVYYTEDFA